MRKVFAACALVAMLGVTPLWAAQPATEHQPETHAAQPAAEGHEGAGEHGGKHGGLFSGLLGSTINFAVLCGFLVYVLRAPVTEYLQGRRTGISKDLVDAAALRTAATAQLAEIDRKVKALPGEIEALRKRGAEEIAAEEQRIAAQASAERERLLEQTRREIDVQVRLAKRDLLEHAADLSVQLATERITQVITPADQDRLVDRYLDQLRSDEAAR